MDTCGIKSQVQSWMDPKRENSHQKSKKMGGEEPNKFLRKKDRNGENCNLVMNQQECSKPTIIISFFFSIFSSSFSCWWWWCCTISSIAGIPLVTCCHHFLINNYNNSLPSIFCSACICTSYLMQKKSLLQILQKNVDILKLDVKIPCLIEKACENFIFIHLNSIIKMRRKRRRIPNSCLSD